jgi:hypothetical protein
MRVAWPHFSSDDGTVFSMERSKKGGGMKKAATNAHRFPRTTVKRYRDEGLDIFGADGNVDAVKFAKAQDEKRSRGQYGTSRDSESRKWDTRFRKAKAEKMELEYFEAARKLVSKDAVVREWRARVVGLRGLLMGLGRELAPRLVGKNPREAQALVDVRTFEILRTFAHQEYMPEQEIEPIHKGG